MNDTLFQQLRKDAREKRVPIGGQFELTPRCTLDCKMCYVHLSHEQMNQKEELSTSEWIKIIDDALKNGLLFSLLTGGECMLHSGFKEIYEHLHQIGVFVTVNTNGFVLSEQNFELLKCIPPRGVNISLYGASEEAYEHVTGFRAFERVMNNVRRLRDAGINVSISITPSTYMLDDVVNIIQLCMQERLKYNISYSLIDARLGTGRSIEDYGLTAEEEVSLREAVRRCTGQKIYNQGQTFSPPNRCGSETICRGIECNAGRGSFVVTWDGVMHPCFRITDIGASLKENSFVDAWRKISTASNDIIVPYECELCSAKKSCNPCHLMRADLNEPQHCNSDMCKRTLLRIRKGLVKYPK